MSQTLRVTFIVHAVVAFILGLGLLGAPGRVLEPFGWAPIDPLMSRMLGAALLALAWGSYRGYRSANWDQVELLVQIEAAFTVLAGVGLLRHLLVANFDWYVWTVFAIYALFAVAWIYHLMRAE